MEPFHPAFLDVWLWSEGMERLLSENIRSRFRTSPLPHFPEHARPNQTAFSPSLCLIEEAISGHGWAVP